MEKMSVDKNLPSKIVCWTPVRNAGVKFCPEAINQYANMPKAKRCLIQDVRMHLSYLGWKIEFSREGNKQRFRYTSPDHSSYLSLHKVCQDLMAPPPIRETEILEVEKQARLMMPIHESEILVEDKELDDLIASIYEEEIVDKEKQVAIMTPIRGAENLDKQSTDCQAVVELGESHSVLDFHMVEPEYCPQAIMDWYRYESNKSNCGKISGRASDVKLKAKKHLAFLGWVFWYTIKSNGKKELRYTSPTGTCYYSLRTACKGCIDGGGAVVERGNLWPSVSDYSDAAAANVSLSAPNKRKRGKNCRMEDESAIETNGNKKPRVLEDVETKKQNPGKGKPIRMKCGKPTVSELRARAGKRVRQDAIPTSKGGHQSVLSWLIDNGVVLPRARVHYLGGEEDRYASLQGRIFRNGIKCYCCQNVFTLSGFELHATGSTHHRPTASLFLDDRRSLLDCQIQSMRSFEAQSPDSVINCGFRQRENDEICSVCHYGGELMLCDGCPSSYHNSCLGMKDVPNGDWFCPFCCCGICGQRSEAEALKRPKGDEFLSCEQCERKYHIGCLRSTGRLRNFPPGNHWFCCSGCEDVYLGLRMLIGKPIAVGIDNLNWILLKYSDALDIEDLAENYSKLKVCVDVMQECFEPVKETGTGKDLVEQITFSRGSNLNRSNFRGFYTIVLERNDEPISVANLRVHGQKVAELPLVATRYHCRRQGMCQLLMNELEKQLSALGVKALILPSAPSVLQTWTNSFGFTKMTKSDRLQYVDCNILDFQDTIMCQKLLVQAPSTPSWQNFLNDDIDYYLDWLSPRSEVVQAEDFKESTVAESRD